MEAIPTAGSVFTGSVSFHSVDWPHSVDDPAYLPHPPAMHTWLA